MGIYLVGEQEGYLDVMLSTQTNDQELMREEQDYNIITDVSLEYLHEIPGIITHNLVVDKQSGRYY